MEYVSLSHVLKQYKETHFINNDETYKQVTISQTGKVSLRGKKKGIKIGRKRQFFINLKKYPHTLVFIRQGVQKGGIGIAPEEVDGCTLTENMPTFSIENINPKYLEYYLKSPKFIKDVSQLVPVGTAQKAIHENKLLKLKIPLPSMEEQDKILEKLEDISVNHFNLSNNHSKNKTYISKLRQAILSEAIQGELVPQDPNDEPASVLLEKIKAEKEKLIKEKKIKKEKPLPKITEEEIPFKIPKNWEWVRLGNIGDAQTGTTPSTKNPEYFNGDIPFIKPADIFKNGINYNNESLTRKGLENGRLIPKDSLMMVCIGGSTGKSYFTDRDVSCNQQINTIKGFSGISGKFIFYFTNSKYFQDEVFRKSTGSATNLINKQRWIEILFPLPPLNEQKRIVEKIDQLMKLCDELESQVKQNQINSEKLMGAVLREAFEQKDDLLVEN